MLSRDSGLPLDMETSGNVFESLPAREGPSAALFENSKNLASSSCGLVPGHTMEHGRRMRRDPQSSSTPTPRLNQGLGTLNPFVSYWRNFRKCENCKRTKITKAPCRKRTGNAILRAENLVM